MMTNLIFKDINNSVIVSKNQAINSTIDNLYLISGFKAANRGKCLTQCNMNTQCYASVYWVNQTCKLYMQQALNSIVYDQNSQLLSLQRYFSLLLL